MTNDKQQTIIDRGQGMIIYTYFHAIPINKRFWMNGTVYTKQSTRTARMDSGQWFYFSQLDLVKVTNNR